READDDVAGDADIAARGFHPRNAFQILLASVETLHGAEHASRSALHRQMHVIAERGSRVDGVDNVAAKIARMRSGETHAPDARNLAHCCQQFGEAALP